MKTILNAFKRGGRGKKARDRGERGERERGVGADSTQTPNTTQSKPQPSLNTTQLTHHHFNNKTKQDKVLEL
jgi:hypothetical protein